MSLMPEFPSLIAALRAGYHVYDRTEKGYLVRSRTANGWSIALVNCSGA
jgi:hypothetical protein